MEGSDITILQLKSQIAETGERCNTRNKALAKAEIEMRSKLYLRPLLKNKELVRINLANLEYYTSMSSLVNGICIAIGVDIVKTGVHLLESC